MKILAIDPGNEKSAFVVWDGQNIIDKDILKNEYLLETVIPVSSHDKLYIEMVASYGMPVGATVFETCVWIGRFIEKFCSSNRLIPNYSKYQFIYRKDVKMYFCNSMRAKDGNIRQALIDRFGVCGTKKNPGLLYGVSKDIWSALAIAVYAYDNIKNL